MLARSTATLIVIIYLGCFTSYVFADGKLSRVRGQVRSERPSPSQPKRDRSQDDDSGVLSAIISAVVDSDENAEPPRKKTRRHEPRRQRRHRNRSRGHLHFSTFGSPVPPVPCAAPVGPFVSVVDPICVPAPVQTVVVREPEVIVIREPVPTAAPIPVPPVEASPICIGESCYFERWSSRLGIYGGTDFGDLSSFGLDLLLQAPGSLGLDLSVATWRESGFSFRDHLWLGDANLVFEPICRSDFRLRLGVGVNWLGDSIGGEAGFNLTSGFDWSLTDRLILAAEGDVGTLGDADFLHAEVALTRFVDSAGLKVGYQYYDIGGVELSGMFAGLEFRF